MAIYTKTGDQGETSLANGKRVPKTDTRLEAYGTVDELNSLIGWLRSSISAQEPAEQLGWIQNKLFNLGASLSEAPGEWITEEDVRRLEQWIDAMQSVLPAQKAFLLPYGSECVTRCHICRTVCRRAERRMTAIDRVDAMELKWINRLSDYLFVQARYIGYMGEEKEEKWQK